MQRYGVFCTLARLFANICMKNVFYNIFLDELSVFISPINIFLCFTAEKTPLFCYFSHFVTNIIDSRFN